MGRDRLTVKPLPPVGHSGSGMISRTGVRRSARGRDLRLVVTATTAASVLPAKTPGTLHY
jgi:hypothetical protein